MVRDEQLANRVREGIAPPTLRIYRWSRSCITVGRRQNADDLPADLLAGHLPIIRRPTGGGAVLHQPDELTYALAIPLNSPVPPEPFGSAVHPELVEGRTCPPRRLPGRIHRFFRDEMIRRRFISPEDLQVVAADSRGPVTLCFSSPVCGDLLYRGRKVAGSALRVWRDGLLLQGTIQGLPVRERDLREILVKFGAEAGSRTPTAFAIAS